MAGFVEWMSSLFKKAPDPNLIKLEQERAALQEANNSLSLQIAALQRDNTALTFMRDGYLNSLNQLKEELKNGGPDTEIEKFCQSNFVGIPNIAYQEKRSIVDQHYNIFINELITPDSWEVENLRRKIKWYNDAYKDALSVGAKIVKVLTWDSDHNLDTSTNDYYLYPNESIARRLCDCEDHAFVVASLNNEFACAWGFYIRNNQLYGHAFNVFVYEGQLYVFDTAGTSYTIVPYVMDKCKYRIHYILTKKYTFQLLPDQSFGQIAKWG